MATAEEIAYVRRNAALANNDATWTDAVIGALVDAEGTDVAIATVWEAKAASYVTAVDVTEAGASHKFSDVYKNAVAMAAYWRKRTDAEAEAEDLSGRVRVQKIVRS
jgi:hypothetical protein